MGKVVIYERVSTDEQREKQTIQTQDTFLGEYCALFGHEVMQTYRDEGVSGTLPFGERPGGSLLLSELHETEPEAALVYKLDRLGRSLVVVVEAHDELLKRGVALKSATESIETTSPSGRLIFQMLASFAEFERGMIRERTQAGFHRAVRAGKQPGRVPYGYRVGTEGWEIVEGEAEVVREILENLAGGGTLYGEAKRLNELGVPAPGTRYAGASYSGERKAGKKWSTTTLFNFARQDAYSGVHRVRAEGGDIERSVPAIVSPEIQRAARETLAGNKARYNRSTDRDYLLSGLVRCGVCGASCVGHPTSSRGKKYHYYVCHVSRVNGRGGHAPYVSAAKLEEAVWKDVSRFLKNPGSALKTPASVRHTQKKTKLTKRLRAKEAERERYVRLYGAGRISEEEFDTYTSETALQAENIRKMISVLEGEEDRAEKSRKAASDTKAWLSSLKSRVRDIERETPEAHEARKRIVNLLVNSVVVGEKPPAGQSPEIEVVYRFAPSSIGRIAAREEKSGLQEDAQQNRFHAVVDSFLNTCGFLLPKPVS